MMSQRFSPDFARGQAQSEELRQKWEAQLGAQLDAAINADRISESDLSIRVNTVAE